MVGCGLSRCKTGAHWQVNSSWIGVAWTIACNAMIGVKLAQRRPALNVGDSVTLVASRSWRKTAD